MNAHNCTGAYIDVGSNIGVQIRKLYEPHKYKGFDPNLKDIASRFGLLDGRTKGGFGQGKSLLEHNIGGSAYL